MKAITSLVLLAFLVAVVKADSCLQQPNTLGSGSACSLDMGYPYVYCAESTFCNDNGVCQNLVSAGGSCSSQMGGGASVINAAACVWETKCQGEASLPESVTCVLATYPGQPCASTSTSTLPQCGTNQCVNGRCAGGSVGDTCSINTDCLSTNCTMGKCGIIPDGANCTANTGGECNPSASFCDLTGIIYPANGTCKPSQTSGQCDRNNGDYPFANQCSTGYVCTQINTTNTYTECVQELSLAAGAFCSNPSTCKSGRCIDEYCAAGSTQYCFDSSQCAYDEVCDCNGLPGTSLSFIGTCQPNPCWSVEQNFINCFVNHGCGANSRYYNGSCLYMNCGSEYLAYNYCASASGLLSSMFLVSMMALIASFLSQKF